MQMNQLRKIHNWSAGLPKRFLILFLAIHVSSAWAEERNITVIGELQIESTGRLTVSDPKTVIDFALLSILREDATIGGAYVGNAPSISEETIKVSCANPSSIRLYRTVGSSEDQISFLMQSSNDWPQYVHLWLYSQRDLPEIASSIAFTFQNGEQCLLPKE
jgi:hypothetical protein